MPETNAGSAETTNKDTKDLESKIIVRGESEKHAKALIKEQTRDR